MTELEMYELWCTLRLWANYNQLNQTIEKNWLSNSFNSHKFPILFFVGLFPISKKLNGTYPLVASIMVAILSIGMCLAVSEVIYRVCPIVLGRRKR
mgnify:CR=1 FL=1